jgi:hypothetical protein
LKKTLRGRSANELGVKYHSFGAPGVYFSPIENAAPRIEIFQRVDASKEGRAIQVIGPDQRSMEYALERVLRKKYRSNTRASAL